MAFFWMIFTRFSTSFFHSSIAPVVGLSPNLVCLALRRLGLRAGGLRGSTVFLGGATLIVDFLAELFETPHPVPDLGIACDEGRLPCRQGLLGRLRGLFAGAKVMVLLGEVLHEVVRTLKFRREGLLFR